MPPRKVDGIVIHRTESGRTGEEVKKNEAKEGLGYHFFIGPTGDTFNIAPDEVIVWHARKWSKSTIAIAVYGDFHVPDGSKNNVPTPAQWAALVSLCKALIAKYGFLFIMGHTDLADSSHYPDKVCPGENLNVQKLAREVYGITSA